MTHKQIKEYFLNKTNLADAMSAWPPFQSLLDDVIRTVLNGSVSYGNPPQDLEEAFKLTASMVVSRWETLNNTVNTPQRSHTYNITPVSTQYVFGLN